MWLQNFKSDWNTPWFNFTDYVYNRLRKWTFSLSWLCFPAESLCLHYVWWALLCYYRLCACIVMAQIQVQISHRVTFGIRPSGVWYRTAVWGTRVKGTQGDVLGSISVMKHVSLTGSWTPPYSDHHTRHTRTNHRGGKVKSVWSGCFSYKGNDVIHAVDLLRHNGGVCEWILVPAQ